MGQDQPSDHAYLRVAEEGDVDALVLAFRKDGRLYELAELEPPAEASLAKL